MNGQRSPEYLEGLLRELCALPYETEWVEFKEDNTDPQEIGEYLSALANSAALAGKAAAYLVWGVRDQDHAVVGSNFDPRSAKKGNEELENWLLRLLEPKIDFHFFPLSTEKGSVILAEINRASRHPVRFAGQEYIRVGSYKKKLKDHPEKERALWRIFDQTPFEEGIALERTTGDDVVRLLDCQAYFDLLKLPQPRTQRGLLEVLASDELIRPSVAGGWDITNLGAILFAKDLDDFRTLRRKAVRVIHYKGSGRLETLKEREVPRGYASGFEGLNEYIHALLPENEVIEQALRRTVATFPIVAVRELVANALIHQDFFATGTGPMVEIFEGRIEITNPGAPLVDIDRLVDAAPKSRNDKLASLMRRFNLCEERGSGIDKVVFQVELFQLPAPLFEIPGDATRATLFAPKALREMNRQERIRACYFHACLNYVLSKPVTNSSIRTRFGIPDHNASTASRLLNEAVEAGVIAVEMANSGTRNRRYVPFWAAQTD
ncbi:MAG: transcriptional regulator [Gemmatimonadetes bacterium]|nr:transcriptional regulator [Gemmatimonadota bacterium]